MDQATYDRLISKLPMVAPESSPSLSGAPTAPATPPQAQPPVPQTGAASGVEAGATPSQPILSTAPNDDPNSPEYQAWMQQQAGQPAPEPGLGDPTSLDAITGGAFKSIFETKDFILGEPDQKSAFRESVEGTVDVRREQSTIDGFSSVIAQFATGMLGAGKLGFLMPGKAKAAAAALPVTAESLKAALVGSVVFDPYEERLSNMVQGTWAANPITEFLQADPADTEAVARLKVALESIGMDIALIGALSAASRAYRYAKGGNFEEGARVLNELQDDAARSVSPEASPQVVEPTATGAQTAPRTSSLSEARSAAGGLPPEAPLKPRVQLADENTTAVVDGLRADAEAIEKYGGWEQAIEAGHTFGRGEGIPYYKLATDSGEFSMFMARVVDEVESGLNVIKGTAKEGTLPDAAVDAMTRRWSRVYDTEPAKFFAAIQRAGREAKRATALMEAGYLVSQRMFRDAFGLAQRIKLGDYTGFGGKAEAMEALTAQLDFASSVYGSARGITASGGRSTRRMRVDFALDPERIAKLRTVDPELLLDVINATGGDPRRLARVGSATMLDRMVEGAQFIYLNNLVSGPLTQAINAVTNSYMLAARPLERIIGGTIKAAGGDPAAANIVKAGIHQYYYMGASLSDAFKNAARTFIRNDSIIAPHISNEFIGAGVKGEVAAGRFAHFKPVKGTSDLLHNLYASAVILQGAPTRILGTVDEFVKQTAYRGYLQANAYVDGMTEGVQQGLKGKALRQFVDDAVDKAMATAFDEAGRGTHKAAMREALISTFQQDLLPGTFGKSLTTVVSNHPSSRFVFPFVKTPTNVIRYGWKMSPLLNAAQVEYRAMFSGRMGLEAQAQAYGQMTLGAAFMGWAAWAVSQGTITGGGPTDSRKAEELKATGWRPYAVVGKAGEGGGPNSFYQFGRFDPIAIPIGIVADLQDYMHAMELEETTPDVDAVIGGLSLALAKQFTSKTYLTGISDFMEAVTAGDTNADKARRYVARIASNFLPYSAAMRQLGGDQYMREARTMMDKLMDTLPGNSNIPARYDAWGEPILNRPGLWTSDTGEVVDTEIQRMILVGGEGPGKVSPYAGSGVDLRDISLEDGRNAYEVYQQLTSKPTSNTSKTLKEAAAEVIQSEAYQKAPDGPLGVKGTRLYLLDKLVMSKYRAAAMKVLKQDRNVRDAILRRQRKVLDHYEAQRAGEAVSKQATEGASLSGLGDAFNVDLDAFLNGPAEGTTGQ